MVPISSLDMNTGNTHENTKATVQRSIFHTLSILNSSFMRRKLGLLSGSPTPKSYRVILGYETLKNITEFYYS